MAHSSSTYAASVGGDERIRLFIGLPIPEDVLEPLAAWQEKSFGKTRDVRIVPPGNGHVTLAFLGHRPVSEIEPITGALRDAATAARPPSLSLRRYRETRSVGMLVFDDDEEERATKLAGDLHGRLEELGVYERENRPWLPHLTVLRSQYEVLESVRLGGG